MMRTSIRLYFFVVCAAAVLLAAGGFAPSSVAAAALKNDPKLIDVATSGDIPAAQKLLTAGADPNGQNGKGLTALDFAAANNHLEIVKLLLAHHARVNLASQYGATPLMYGSGGGASPPVIAALLSAGASVNARDVNGATPLAFAAAYNGRGDSAALLISEGADVEAEVKEFDRPLSMAAARGNSDVIKELLKAGANAGFALVWEVYHQKPDAVRALLDAGVDVNARYPKAHFGPSEGTTALIEAAFDNDMSMVRTLIDAGADVNAVVPGDSNMPTALTMAAYFCNADMIRLLLDHGAVRSFRNASGDSAADLARTGWTHNMEACPADVQALLQ